MQEETLVEDLHTFSSIQAAFVRLVAAGTDTPATVANRKAEFLAALDMIGFELDGIGLPLAFNMQLALRRLADWAQQDSGYHKDFAQVTLLEAYLSISTDFENPSTLVELLNQVKATAISDRPELVRHTARCFFLFLHSAYDCAVLHDPNLLLFPLPEMAKK